MDPKIKTCYFVESTTYLVEYFISYLKNPATYRDGATITKLKPCVKELHRRWYYYSNDSNYIKCELPIMHKYFKDNNYIPNKNSTYFQDVIVHCYSKEYHP